MPEVVQDQIEVLRVKLVINGTDTERLAYDTTDLPLRSEWILPNGDIWEWSKVGWVQTKTGGASHVQALITGDETVIPPRIFSLYSGVAAAANILDAGIEVYDSWMFQFLGALDADDTMRLEISLEGSLGFVSPGLVDVMTGAHIPGGTDITAAGIYRFGTATDQSPILMSIAAIQTSRILSVTGGNIDVIAIASKSQ